MSKKTKCMIGSSAASRRSACGVGWRQVSVSVRTLMVGGMAILLAWGLAATAAAENSSSESRYYEWLRRQSAEREAEQAEEEAAKRHWQELYRQRRSATEVARADLERVSRGRVSAQDGAYAGVPRSEWTRRWEEAKARLAEAELALKEFSEEARRAEVPPGWLREVEDPQEAIHPTSPE